MPPKKYKKVWFDKNKYHRISDAKISIDANFQSPVINLLEMASFDPQRLGNSIHKGNRPWYKAILRKNAYVYRKPMRN